MLQSFKKIFLVDPKISKCVILAQNGTKLLICCKMGIFWEISNMPFFSTYSAPSSCQISKKSLERIWRYKDLQFWAQIWRKMAHLGQTRIFWQNPYASFYCALDASSSWKISKKSLEPFSRKSRKSAILTTFLYFLDDPKFFWIIRLCHFSHFIDV